MSSDTTPRKEITEQESMRVAEAAQDVGAFLEAARFGKLAHIAPDPQQALRLDHRADVVEDDAGDCARARRTEQHCEHAAARRPEEDRAAEAEARAGGKGEAEEKEPDPEEYEFGDADPQFIRDMAKFEVRKELAEPGQRVRGIIVCRTMSEDLVLACASIKDVELFEYKLQVTVSRVPSLDLPT